MGNKSKICHQIFEVTSKVMLDSSDFTVFDPFAGTTNVSRCFKKKGINVIGIESTVYKAGKAVGA